MCTRGAAGIWAVDLFSTTYFGQIIIFVVSKDQTFRIRCTLMNPEQFLILVPYLILYGNANFICNFYFLFFLCCFRSVLWFHVAEINEWTKLELLGRLEKEKSVSKVFLRCILLGNLKGSTQLFNFIYWQKQLYTRVIPWSQIEK